MPSTGPFRPSHRGPLIASALLGLAAGAVGLSASAGGALRGAGPAQRLGWLIAVVCFGVLIWLAINFSKWRNLSSALAPQSKTSRLRAATAAILFAGAVVVPILLIAMSSSTSSPNAVPLTPQTEKPVPQPTQKLPTILPGQPKHGSSANLTPFLIALGVVAGLVLLALLVYRLRQLNLRLEIGPIAGRAEPEPEQEEQALADAMSAGRRALQGDDARAAIIACYAAMEQSLAAVGVARSVADSPADLLGRAQSRGLLQGSGPLVLTALFREARFSVNPMGPQQMTAARTALEECSAQLSEAEAMVR